MVLRQLGDVEKRQNIEESIKRAKDAVSLDLLDSTSWYILGNAHLANFFNRGLEGKEDKENALRAYQQAEKRGEDWNPDLYYNRAFLHTYTENYGPAVEGFERAASLYREWDAPRIIASRIRDHVRAVSAALEGRGAIKAKRLPVLASAAQAITTQISCTSVSTNVVPLKKLAIGANPGLCICVKIALVLIPPVAAMASLIVVDGERGLGAVSLYNIEPANVKQGDSLVIRSPIVYSVSLPKNNVVQTYCTIMADYPAVELGGHPFDKHLLATPTLTLNTNV